MHDHKRDSNYHRVSSAVVIVLESGAAYFISLTLYIALYLRVPGVAVGIIQTAMPQVLVRDFAQYCNMQPVIYSIDM